MNFVLTLHGEVRWLVALVAVVAVVKFAIGWLGKKEYTSLDRRLMSAVTILMDINLLLGLILLFGLGGGFPMNRVEHATTMFLAVVVAHSSAAWRKSDDAQKKFRNNLIAVVVALALVFTAVIRLRGGWIF
ncbi:MAG: hypothetical protein Kow0080_22630 [Candidatus Promineifilaceae bacterium]